MTFEGLDLIKSSLSKGRGGVIAFYHWGVFQAFLSVLISELEHPTCLIAADEPLKYQKLLLETYQPELADLGIMLPVTSDIIRQGVDQLQENHLVCLLPEVSGVASYRKPKTTLEFLGAQVYAPEGAAALARFSGAPLFSARIEETAPYRVTCYFEQIAESLTGFQAIHEGTVALWRNMEKHVLEKPEQWGGWEIFDRIRGY